MVSSSLVRRGMSKSLSALCVRGEKKDRITGGASYLNSDIPLATSSILG